jgi:GNAT superfamily N-acetyltransferase
VSSTATTIRRAALRDASGLAAVINRAFLVEEFFVDGDRTHVDEIAAKMREGIFLAAEDDGELVGCVYAQRRSDGRGYIGLLAVDPLRKGRGVGKILMAAAEEWCRAAGCAMVDLSVVSVRTELFPFYASLGYVERGVAPFADRPTKLPCHFVVLTKPLADSTS